jgi:Uma2 family endonuclease
MAAIPDLITVEQFRQLPIGSEFAYELHCGEVVPLPWPKARYWKLRTRLSRLIETKLKAFGEVGTRMPFRLVAEFDLRAADVAVVSRERWVAIDVDYDLRGAPELVIEVRSPSNTARQLRELVALCLANGALECWIVDTDQKSVTVIARDGGSLVYSSGGSVPLARFGGGDLPIDEIFA